MIDTSSVHQSAPFLRANEEQLVKIKRQLEWVFRELWLVQDVLKICGGACESVSSELDGEVEHVLRRCGSDRLHAVMTTLTEIVERFGGKTEMSETEGMQ